jgi:hypothetical protein
MYKATPALRFLSEYDNNIALSELGFQKKQSLDKTVITTRINDLMQRMYIHKLIKNNVIFVFLFNILSYIFLLFTKYMVRRWEDKQIYKMAFMQRCNNYFSFWQKDINYDQIYSIIDQFIDNYTDDNRYYDNYHGSIYDKSYNINWIAYNNKLLIWIISHHTYNVPNYEVYTGEIFYAEISINQIMKFNREAVECYEINENMLLTDFKYYGDILPQMYVPKSIFEYVYHCVLHDIKYKY